MGLRAVVFPAGQFAVGPRLSSKPKLELAAEPYEVHRNNRRNPLDIGRGMTGPHFCSVPTKASVDVAPVPSASSAAAAAAQRAGGEDGELLLFPFRHRSTVFIEMTDM